MRIIIVALWALTSSLAHADALRGNQLLEMMQSQEYADNNGAFFYILGVMNAKELQIYKDNLRAVKDSKLDERPFCLPDKANNGQIFDIVKKFLIDNPASRHEQALPLIQIALSRALPCP